MIPAVTQTLEDLPLRERRAALTRHRLITAALELLKRRTYSEVRVADLCRTVPISEPTFFKHFPTKAHLLVHVILLWGLAVESRVRDVERRSGPKRAIEEAFEEYGDQMRREPTVAQELLAHQAARRGPPRFPKISIGDRRLWFPDRAGIEEIDEVGIVGILTPRVEACRREGVLPSSVSTQTGTETLLSVFFGVPMTLLWKDASAVPRGYREQLEIAWRGLGVRKP